MIVLLSAVLLAFTAAPSKAQAPELLFDHNHTYGEVVDYLQEVVSAFPASPISWTPEPSTSCPS